jgi:hypothetical protein
MHSKKKKRTEYCQSKGYAQDRKVLRDGTGSCREPHQSNSGLEKRFLNHE